MTNHPIFPQFHRFSLPRKHYIFPDNHPICPFYLTIDQMRIMSINNKSNTE